MANTSATERGVLAESGIDGLALKPTEVDVEAIADGQCETIARSIADATLVIDYEGRDAVPDGESLESLLDIAGAVRVTTPVRADGFDPLGEAARGARLPAAVDRVFVAGHPAYLEDHERTRAVAPRLRAAVVNAADPWVGTEGVERAALAAGGTQFELLSPTVERDVRSLRAAGYDGEIAVYAPTVRSTDETEILDAVGDYVARREAVATALPENAAADGLATGEARRILSEAAREYAIVGDRETIRERTAALREAGVDYVVAYPAAGIESLLG